MIDPKPFTAEGAREQARQCATGAARCRSIDDLDDIAKISDLYAEMLEREAAHLGRLLVLGAVDELYQLKLMKDGLRLLRRARFSGEVEAATIEAMITNIDVRIGRNRCRPTCDGKHSDDCDGACAANREPFPMVADENDDPKTTT